MKKFMALTLLIIGFTSVTVQASCEDQASELAATLSRSTNPGQQTATAEAPQTLASKP